MTTASAKECPVCGARGRPVKAETLDALLLSEAKARMATLVGFNFCGSRECDTVYFRNSDDTRLGTADLSVPVFQKSEEPRRLVCYCFQHSVAELQGDVERAGDSAVPNGVTEKCRQGLDRCHLTNPQGVCCLGNVRALVKQAKQARSLSVADEHASTARNCCAPVAESAEACPLPTESAPARVEGDSNANASGRRGMWSAGGALVAAVLSSACCWLPLALIGFGASAAGFAGFFESYRFAFAGGALLSLGAGFYYVYFKKPACTPGDACAVPNPRLQRFNRIMLWSATLLVAAFVTFPEYVGQLLADQDRTATFSAADTAVANGATGAQTVTRTYSIVGMTCEGCTVHVVEALEEVPGVKAAEVSYQESIAKVTLIPSQVPDEAIVQAVETSGYEATVAPSGANRN